MVVGDWIGFRREADRILRRIGSAAWIIDRPPALLSHAVENPRPLEPAFTRSAREVVQGRGAGTQSNPNSGSGYELLVSSANGTQYRFLRDDDRSL